MFFKISAFCWVASECRNPGSSDHPLFATNLPRQTACPSRTLYVMHLRLLKNLNEFTIFFLPRFIIFQSLVCVFLGAKITWNWKGSFLPLMFEYDFGHMYAAFGLNETQFETPTNNVFGLSAHKSDFTYLYRNKSKGWDHTIVIAIIYRTFIREIIRSSKVSAITWLSPQ